MKRCFLPAAAVFILAAGSWLSAQTSGSEAPFRVELKRIDGVLSGVGTGFYFEADMVAETLKKFPVKLLQPMPPDSKLGYFYGGPIWAILQKTPDPAKVLLTMDTNANFDLADDKAVELGLRKNWEDGVIVKFARPFEKRQRRTEWLPYRISYSVYTDRDGKSTDQVNISSDYHFKGDFRLYNRDYEIVLEDGDSRGRFIREKLVNVFLQIKEKDSKEPARGRRLFELIPIEDALYEVKGFAEDGSWVEFAKSTLPKVALGKPFADMELTDTTGRTFKLSDYKDTLILLDFWPSWCVPCVAQFDEIKKTLAQYQDRPLTVLGINIDEAARLEKARSIVAEKQLTWPQIMDGKGEFIPVYQVYGRLPERENIFPIYAAVDRKGIARYATNAWNNMARFLAAELKDEENGTNDLFIPLSSGAGMKISLSDPIEFTPAVVREFLEAHPAKLPPDLVAEAKVGLMSNDALAVLIPAAKAETFNLIVDTDRDFDLSCHLFLVVSLVCI